MNKDLINIDDVKSVLEKVGLGPEESEHCMTWTCPELNNPLTDRDKVLVELSPEEEGFLRCMGYVYEEKDVHPFRLMALHETFWKTIRSLHNLPQTDLTVKGGKYIVKAQEIL